MFLWGFLGYEGLTNQGFGYIMHAGYEGLEGLKVWGWEVWAPGHYDAIYKNAQSPTLLHFHPFLPYQKNISKDY